MVLRALSSDARDELEITLALALQAAGRREERFGGALPTGTSFFCGCSYSGCRGR